MVTNKMLVLSLRQRSIKRAFDLILSTVGILFTFWLIIFVWIVASLDTRSNGFFLQKRVGKDGKIFKVIKIKTMIPNNNIATTVTKAGDPRITLLGAFFRKAKIDELPQLINVLIGNMSFVGPRPDVPGFADELIGEERAIISIRPGITGPATLKYSNEEAILSHIKNPEEYNRDVIWPDKVKLNLDYIREWSLKKDIGYIWQTIFG